MNINVLSEQTQWDEQVANLQLTTILNNGDNKPLHTGIYEGVATEADLAVIKIKGLIRRADDGNRYRTLVESKIGELETHPDKSAQQLKIMRTALEEIDNLKEEK